MYHWRVLASEPAPLEGDLDFWRDSPAVRARLEAIARASSQLVLFSEYVPQNLLTWLSGQLARSTEEAAAAIAFVDEQLMQTIDFMNAQGMTHFDAHFENILTDGRRLYFADFGLALSSDFALTDDEVEFLARHRSYDFDRAASSYAHCVIRSFFGGDRWKEKLRNYFATDQTTLPAPVAAVLQRQGPRALAFLEFVGALHEQRKRADRP